MNAFLLAISISSTVLQNSFFNLVSKKHFKNKRDMYTFNLYTYAMCVLLFGIMMAEGGISLFTLGLASIFGLATFIGYIFKMRAYANGPMHITTLITTSSMIIPALSGAMIFGEAFSIYKGLAIIALVFFIFLSTKRDGGGQSISGKWFACCVISFFATGSIGVMQKIHQASEYKNELSAFLAVAFVFSLFFAAIMQKKEKADSGIKKSTIAIAAVCGICTFTMNFLNLRLSGIIPAQIFFPLVNGGAIFLSSLVSFLVFREKLTLRQFAGLLGGIVSLIVICLV